MPQGPKLLDQVCAAVRVRHYSIRTEKAYVSTHFHLKFNRIQDIPQHITLRKYGHTQPLRCAGKLVVFSQKRESAADGKFEIRRVVNR